MEKNNLFEKIPMNGVKNIIVVASGKGVTLMPDQRLGLGSKVVVSIRTVIRDQDGEASDATSWSFTVRGAEEIGDGQ